MVCALCPLLRSPSGCLPPINFGRRRTITYDIVPYPPYVLIQSAPTDPTPSPPSSEQPKQEKRDEAEPKDQQVDKDTPPPPAPQGGAQGGRPADAGESKKDVKETSKPVPEKKESKPKPKEEKPSTSPVAGSRNETRVRLLPFLFALPVI